MSGPVLWPEGKRFAFTVFDDTDRATLENVGPVYSFLSECGFRTTKSCWVVRGDPGKGTNPGATCEDADYLKWLLDLEARGYEIGWHNSTWHGLPRPAVVAAMDRFVELFHHNPVTAANHSEWEGIYFGNYRLTGLQAWIYNLLTCYRNRGRHRGHIEGDEYFWGDLCRERIKYVRNFVYRDINTLKCCPCMPYHDPRRPYVNYWFASSNGNEVGRFCECLGERNQDRLEEEGGACIMYAHFAYGFAERGAVQQRFASLMRRLARKNGWFVPVGTLLDHLLRANGHHEVTAAQRRRLERRWLWEKIFIGTN